MTDGAVLQQLHGCVVISTSLPAMEGCEVEDSEKRWFETKRSLHNAKVPYFLRTISEKHIRRPALSHDVRTFEMDIPAAFVRDHGEQMKPSATIQAAGDRDGDGGQVWPVQIHIIATPFRARVGFSRGFHKFLLTNDLNVGDQLIFSLPAMSKFVVYMFKLHKITTGRRCMAPATPSSSCTPSSKKEWMPFEDMADTIFPAHHHHHHPVKVEPGCEVNDLDAKRGTEMMMSKKIKEKIKVKGEHSWSVNRQIVDEEPESEEEEEEEEEEQKEEEEGEIRSSQISFRKVVSASSASGKHGTPVCFARLELPIEFVRCYVGKYVESDAEYTLEVSPTGRTWQVVCQRTAGGRIHFTHGWNEFATANQLRPGEGLIFTLAPPRRFVVQILQLDQRRGRPEEDSEEYTNAWHKRKSGVYDDAAAADDDDDDEFDFQVKKPHHVTLKHDDGCGSESPKSEDRPVWSLKNSSSRMSDLVQQWARNRIARLKAGRVDPYEDRKHDEKRSSLQQEEEEEEDSFIKKLPDSSSSKCSPYPFVNIPVAFSRNHLSWFQEQVYLQGPKSTECFPVKCAGSGTMKSFTTGWKRFFDSNSLESGDVLRFTHTTKTSFSVSYYL